MLGAQQVQELACLNGLLCVAGLNVHLHHNYSVHLHAPRTQYEYDLQIPLRKMVDCRTRDLHQSLLVKLNRALVRQGKSGSTVLEGARSLRAFSHHPALEGPGTASTRLPSGHFFLCLVDLGISAQEPSACSSLLWGHPCLRCHVCIMFAL